MRNRMQLVLLAALFTASCREADGPLGGSASGQLIVSSDPEGAHIFIDDIPTETFTPDTIRNIGGSHTVVVLLDSSGWTYNYGARVVIVGSEPLLLDGPLTTRCTAGGTGSCFNRNRQTVTAGNMIVSLNALGSMMLEDGSGQGLMWPTGTLDSYVSNAMPMIAAKVAGRGVALGMYDIAAMAGRPAPTTSSVDGVLRTDQRTWIVPTTTSTSSVTIRGIEVREQMLFDASRPDIVLVRLTYRNITNSPMYQRLDARGAEFGSTGLVYDDVFIGFGMDPDIGDATNDLMTYDPAQNTVFAYDADFNETQFGGAAAQAPGLIGLRMLSAPGGARVVLNGYGTQNGQGSTSDWHAGTADETTGWSVLSGTAAYAPDDPDPNIGMLVQGAADVRMMVSAGPYTLRPADELSIVVAVALAQPQTGSFATGTVIVPGDPHNPARSIMTVAAGLRQKLSEAELLLPKLGN